MLDLGQQSGKFRALGGVGGVGGCGCDAEVGRQARTPTPGRRESRSEGMPIKAIVRKLEVPQNLGDDVAGSNRHDPAAGCLSRQSPARSDSCA